MTDLRKVRWKTAPCHQAICWCSTIVPEQEILDEEGSPEYVIHAGVLSKEMAEHIVFVHNWDIEESELGI